MCRLMLHMCKEECVKRVIHVFALQQYKKETFKYIKIVNFHIALMDLFR